jgi:hypothetical protein
MTDMIYYKNGEETFRISPPTVGTKCPETKLEVKKMNEKEQLKAQIQELQEQLQKLEEITPVEEAYKRVYGFYPETYEDSWSSFQDGYIAAQKDYKVEEPEELKTLYQMFYDEKWSKSGCDDICKVVEEWMSQYADNVLCGECKKGYEYCLTVLEENLK